MSRKMEGRAGTGRLRGWDLPRGSRAVGLRVQVIPDLFCGSFPESSSIQHGGILLMLNHLFKRCARSWDRSGTFLAVNEPRKGLGSSGARCHCLTGPTPRHSFPPPIAPTSSCPITLGSGATCARHRGGGGPGGLHVLQAGSSTWNTMGSAAFSCLQLWK